MQNFFVLQPRDDYRKKLVSQFGEGHWLVKNFDKQCEENDAIISGVKIRPTLRAVDAANAANGQAHGATPPRH